jgi:hypothetical protein
MGQAIEKLKVSVNEKEYEVEIFEKHGKVYAKTHINNFGEVTVPDFGGGKEKAVKNMEVRINNILKAIVSDDEREARKKQKEEEKAQKQQGQSN